MNAAYHQRFFSDIRFTTVVVLLLFAGALGVDRRLFLAVPVIALLGACQTAFDASYLIFSRQYATRLERFLNQQLGRDLLVAHRLEETYLFPLDRPKVVTLAFSSGGFTWFGFMTALYTLAGAGVYTVGLIGSLDAIGGVIGIRAGGTYLIVLAAVTVTAIAVGAWWFPGGEGERRLRAVLDETFGTSEEAVA